MELQFDNQTPDTAKPVTVLGRTFATDEERRTYFREELRKQLPELKKIEGFPIGEDEDILRLSDPPYYTACPNPWINDFIAEWETEKIELEAQGKRVPEFEVDEPYASDVSEGKYEPIYKMHPYHTKVPHIAIMKYILHYTQPGDIVFDGFSGTGMTGVACKSCENPDVITKNKIESEFQSIGLKKPSWGARNPILGDLSSMSSFISYIYNSPVDNSLLSNEIKDIITKLKEECDPLFSTQNSNGERGIISSIFWSDIFLCKQCNHELSFWEVAVNKEKGLVLEKFNCKFCNTELAKSELDLAFQTKVDLSLNKVIKEPKRLPVLINYVSNKKKLTKVPDNFDLNQLEIIENTKIPYWHPINRMCAGSESRRNDKFGIENIHQFYFKRNLFVLSKLYDLIEKPYLLQFLTVVAFRITKRYSLTYMSGTWGAGGGPTSGTMYVPSLIKDLNIIDMIGQAVTKRLKIDNSTFRNSPIYTQSSSSTNIKDSSIDYMFLDPPFGSNLNYSELNFIWEGWLKVFTNIKEEAIENKTQNKNLVDYKNLFTLCLREAYRILKHGKWLTVEFSNTKASVWNVVQTSISEAGFIIANVSALDKQKGSFVSLTTPTAVKQDLVISCYKPSSDFDTKFQQSQNSEVGIWDFVTEHLSHLSPHLAKDNATTAIIERSPKILFDRLIAFYVQRNLPVPIDAGLFQKGLKERFVERDGMYFTAEQVHEYDSKKAELPNFVQLSLLVASEQDGVMWLRRELEHTAQTYQELQPKWMQALAGVRKGDILPELKDILEENFLQNESGAWYLPDLENEIDLEKVRTGRMLRLFATYREQASKPKGKIKEARVEALRVGFKQCYKDKDFKTIVTIGDSIPNNLLMEDEVLLQYYDIAISRV